VAEVPRNSAGRLEQAERAADGGTVATASGGFKKIDKRRLALTRLGRTIRKTVDVFLGQNMDSDTFDADEFGEYAKPEPSTPQPDDGKELQIISVVETRLSGLILHSMILSSVLLLPFLQYIPMPVIYGIFLYLGRKVMTGNEFLKRIIMVMYDVEKLPSSSAVAILGRRKVLKFVGIQAGCLSTLWILKSFKPTALFFPSVIGALVVMRRKVLPRWFSEEDLAVLDSNIDD
jgi:hypothetical protein